MTSPLTKEQAIELAESKFWEVLTPRQIAEFQLSTELLCMPFDVFHGALEKALGRPVWTHEMGLNWEGLKAELYGDAMAPTMDDIIALIPADKRIIVVADAS